MSFVLVYKEENTPNSDTKTLLKIADAIKNRGGDDSGYFVVVAEEDTRFGALRSFQMMNDDFSRAGEPAENGTHVHEKTLLPGEHVAIIRSNQVPVGEIHLARYVTHLEN